MQRTRSSLLFFVATCVLCLTRSTICVENPNPKETLVSKGTKLQEEKPVASVSKAVIKLNQNVTNKLSTTEQQTGKNVTSKSKVTTTSLHNKSIEHTLSSSEVRFLDVIPIASYFFNSSFHFFIKITAAS